MSVLRLAALALVAAQLACAPRLARPGPEEREIPDEARVKLAVAAYEQWLDSRKGFYRAAYRLREAAAPECRPHVVPMFGSLETRRESHEGNPVVLRAAELTLDPGEQPTIVVLVPEGPLARAGAHLGDRIVSVEGHPVGSDDDAEDMAVEYAPEDGSPIELVVSRADEELELSVEQVAGCRSWIRLRTSDDLFVGDDVRRVERSPDRWAFFAEVSTGLVELAASEDEVAVLLGHLVAHAAIETSGDPRKAMRRREIGREADMLALERQADRLGLEIADRAGYDVTPAVAFWERLALERPGLIGDGWHGFIAQRLGPLGEGIRELRGSEEERGRAAAGP